jgi:hypothetical protein
MRATKDTLQFYTHQRSTLQGSKCRAFFQNWCSNDALPSRAACVQPTGCHETVLCCTGAPHRCTKASATFAMLTIADICYSIRTGVHT